MIILGLHFGHDGAVAVVRDGEVLVSIESERLTRFKHSIGLTIDDIETALQSAGHSLDEIAFCGVTSTQQIEYVFEDPSSLSFKLDFENSSGLPCSILGPDRKALIEAHSKQYLKRVVESGGDHPYLNRIPEHWRSGPFPASQPTFEEFMMPAEWQQPAGLKNLSSKLIDAPLSDAARFGMHFPITVKLRGRSVPGFMFSHHYAHAASAFYMSAFDEAVILSHDGSLPATGYWGGMIYYGESDKLWPIAPHYLGLGFLYERIAVLLGLGMDTGAGKLMGLAPYGKPVFFDHRFLGNVADGDDIEETHADITLPDNVGAGRSAQYDKWLRHCLGEARRLGYDFGPLGDPSRILEPINVDIAASTQKLLEESLLECVASAKDLLSGLGKSSDNLCMTGGVALNCPANSLVYKAGLFSNISVPPYVHDGGLAIGAALAISHNLLETPRPPRTMDVVENAYLGVQYSGDTVEAALQQLPAGIELKRGVDAARLAAERLARNEVIGWFDGRSEIGPRALGHRSILSNACHEENWARVNRIKSRERWRPFAPAVLLENSEEWFEGCPIPSSYMLFTAQVKNDRIPAVTHVDGSSRIQTVDAQNGRFRDLLLHFKELTGVPVIMNTSFNGPGEPIVETVEQAIAFLRDSELDALYVGDNEITRSAGKAN